MKRLIPMTYLSVQCKMGVGKTVSIKTGNPGEALSLVLSKENKTLPKDFEQI